MNIGDWKKTICSHNDDDNITCNRLTFSIQVDCLSLKGNLYAVDSKGREAYEGDEKEALEERKIMGHFGEAFMRHMRVTKRRRWKKGIIMKDNECWGRKRIMQKPQYMRHMRVTRRRRWGSKDNYEK